MCRCITTVALLGLPFKLNLCSCRRPSFSTASPRALNRKRFIHLHQPTAQNCTVRIAAGGWRAGFFCCETVFLPSFLSCLFTQHLSNLCRDTFYRLSSRMFRLSPIFWNLSLQPEQRPVHVPLSGSKPPSKPSQFVAFLYVNQVVESLRIHFPVSASSWRSLEPSRFRALSISFLISSTLSAKWYKHYLLHKPM